MSIAKVHNFKGLSKFERVGGKKKDLITRRQKC